jgi:phosphate:Na+ symporter
VSVSVILFPFIKPLAALTRRLVPIIKDTRKAKLTQYIDESQFRMPDIALAEATKELHRIGEIAADMLNLSREAVIQGNLNAADRILELEYGQVNPLCARLEGFLSELMREDLSQKQSRRCMHLIEMTTDVERVSDFTEDLVLMVKDNHKQDRMLSEIEIGELDQFFKDAHKTYTTALVAVRDNNREIAMVVSNMEEKMDRQYTKARKKYIKRIGGGKIAPDSDNFYLEVLRNLERICDHADSLGISVMRGL